MDRKTIPIDPLFERELKKHVYTEITPMVIKIQRKNGSMIKNGCPWGGGFSF